MTRENSTAAVAISSEQLLAEAHRAMRHHEAEVRALSELLAAVRGERDEALQMFAVERAERAAAERRLYEEGRQVTALATELRRLEGKLRRSGSSDEVPETGA